MFSICCCLRGEDERYETNGSPPCGLGDCFLSLFSVMIKPSGYDQAVKLPTTQVIIPSSFYAPENDDEDACPTCLEEFTPENPKITTKCNHSYHLGCIYEWKERSNLCPICRREMEFDEST
ncbi:hypothetical protein UlMin_040985 [Ulmus minor]